MPDPFSTSHDIKRQRAIREAQQAAQKATKRETLDSIAANEARAKQDPNSDIGYLRRCQTQRKFYEWGI